MNAFEVTNERWKEDPRKREDAPALSDEQLVRRVRGGETELFEVLLRRHNRRVYRAARSVLCDDTEAEEVAQEAWVRAFDHLDQFAGRGSFATWVTRIALYESWARARRDRRGSTITTAGGADEATCASAAVDPESAASDREVHGLIQAAIDSLPEKYRIIFVLREVEGLSTAEAAASLKVSQMTAKTRLHRARALLRRELLERAGTSIAAKFPFAGSRCDRTTANVMARILPAISASVRSQ